MLKAHWGALVLVPLLSALHACAAPADNPAPSGRIADVPGAVESRGSDHAGSITPRDSALLSLARAGGGDGSIYRPSRDTTALHAGMISGRVESANVANGDSAIVPTHDLGVCKPFTESPLPSSKNGVGNAVVWLVGVETGPVQDASLRANLMLDRCRLEPRVQRMAAGGTLMVTSRDAMMSRLRFIDATNEAVVRTQVALNDAGQVVPTSAVAGAPGLVEIRDDLHPWVRGYIAVAMTPFVAVTEADGVFRFDGVPAGNYTLGVWQEKLGVKTTPVRVTSAVETKISVKY